MLIGSAGVATTPAISLLAQVMADKRKYFTFQFNGAVIVSEPAKSSRGAAITIAS